MNIKFKDTVEYKEMMADFKKESLKLKNKNIHLTALMKNLRKHHKELEIVDDIVKTFLQQTGYQIPESTDDIDFDDIEDDNELDHAVSNLTSKKIKDPVDDLYNICRKFVKVLEIGVKNVRDYISYAYSRYSSRHALKERQKKLREFTVEILKNKIRGINRKDLKEIQKKGREATHTIGIWNVANTYLLRKLAKATAQKINELFKYFIKPTEENELFFIDNPDELMSDITIGQSLLIQDRLGVKII